MQGGETRLSRKALVTVAAASRLRPFRKRGNPTQPKGIGDATTAAFSPYQVARGNPTQPKGIGDIPLPRSSGHTRSRAGKPDSAERHW